MPGKETKPINREEEIRQNPDPKIDEDFQGYPGGPAKDATIKPVTPADIKTADLGNKDGEKRIIHPDNREGLDEQESDGSANAFEEK
jgi:hypothetical protein